MKFKISKSISNAAWGGVDKSRIWQILKKGLEDGAEGAAEAVREVYAVVKMEINKDLTEADCKMPHHEVSEDGTITLNRAGVIAAAAALAGARSEPDLTPEQKAQAKQHLLRHYRQLEMTPPEALTGEMAQIMATVSGEIRVEDVPLAPWADLAALKAGDDDPLEVVVEIPAGKSKRGWNYTPQALQRIVGEVMSQGLPGFLGHQKPEDVDHQFPLPVTHWVGALWRDGKAYFRGVVDKAAADLKRWIRAKTVRTVSIFGAPKLQQVAGETQVVDYRPLSIDWTPLGRAGMPTAVVALGEMDEIIGGEQTVTLAEMLAAIRAAIAKKEIALDGVIGEIGFTKEQVLDLLGGEDLKKAKNGAELAGKLLATLGFSGEMKTEDALRLAGEMKVAYESKLKADREKLVDDVIKEKVVGEMGQALVKKMLRLPEAATKEQIAGEIDKLLANETLKETFSKLHIDKPAGVVSNGSDQQTGLRARRVAI